MHVLNEAETAAFTAYADDAMPRLRRLGYLICGDWQRSEDAVQDSLLKVYRAWRQITDRTAVDAYARRTLSRQLVDESRRPWRRRERTTETLPDREIEGGDSGDIGDIETAWTVRAALQAVPPRQRAVLALRYYEQLDVRETAQVMRCSEGTVKSQTSRGLAHLRRLLGTSYHLNEGIESDDRTAATHEAHPGRRTGLVGHGS